jgi:hypothetical protein
MALGIVPGDLDSAIKSFANLKTELDKEKTVRKATRIEVATLTHVIKDSMISTDKFAAQIPTLEDKVKHLENKVVDGLNKVKSPLCLEHTTRVNDNYKK